MRIDGSSWLRGFPPLAGGWPESPLEDLFLHQADKYVSRLVTIHMQDEVQTPHGGFRLDFAFRSASRTPIAIECDGAAWHLSGFANDRWRDAAILAWSEIGLVIRIVGRRLHRYPTAVWFALYRIAPWAFGPGAEDVLRSEFRMLEADVHQRRLRAEGYAWDDALAWDSDLVDSVHDEWGDLVPLRLMDREVVALADLTIHSPRTLSSEIEWLQAHPTMPLRTAMTSYLEAEAATAQRRK